MQNGGDGLAYPYFFDSEALAVWDQENMEEGWGECCSGVVTFSGHGALTVERPQVYTRYDVLGMLLFEYDGRPVQNRDLDKAKAFVRTFFAEGLPELYAVVLDAEHYGILATYLPGAAPFCLRKIWNDTTNDAGREQLNRWVQEARKAVLS